MKDHYSKIVLVVALGIAPTAAFATYGDCVNAGGSGWSCFWQAAFNDGHGIVAPGDTTQTLTKFSEAEIKASFDKNNEACSKLPVNQQMSCLSRDLKPKKAIVESKPVGSKANKVISSKVKKMATKSNAVIKQATPIKSK